MALTSINLWSPPMVSVPRHGPASWMPTPFPLIWLSFPQPACLRSRNSSSKGSEGEDRYADGCKYGGFRKSQDLAFSGSLSGLHWLVITLGLMLRPSSFRGFIRLVHTLQWEEQSGRSRREPCYWIRQSCSNSSTSFATPDR